MSKPEHSESESGRLDDVQLEAAVGGATIGSIVPCVKTRSIVPCVKTAPTIIPCIKTAQSP